jgi:hypothetical protein
MKTLLISLTLLLQLLPADAFAFGEIFKIESSGTEYCGDFNTQKFNAGNNLDTWIQLVSETEITASFTSNFVPGTTFPMAAQTYVINGVINGNSAAVVGGHCLGLANSFLFKER